MARRKISGSFTGYDKVQVDAYLDSLMQSNAMKLEELRRRIDDCMGERDRLKAELSEKYDKIEDYKKSRKYMEFAFKRVESIAGMIASAGDSECKELDEICRVKLNEYDSEIERLSLETKNKQEHLGFLLRRASKPKVVKLNGAEEAPKQRLDEDSYPSETRDINSGRSKGTGFWDDSSYREKEVHTEGLSGKAPVRPGKEEAYDRVQGSDTPGSAALSADINQVRNKYLVGKVAGEDLLAKNGSVIIAKNGVITAETVRRAEEEGKLAELIINMILPGMES